LSGVAYRYELRRDDEVIATGHMTRERALTVGEEITMGKKAGIVRSIEPRLGETELHLVVQLDSSRKRWAGSHLHARSLRPEQQDEVRQACNGRARTQ
jgi:hypothetical protein